MTSTWCSVRCSERFPDFLRGFGVGDKRLDGGRQSTDETIVNEPILSSPFGEVRVDGGFVVDGDSLRRRWFGSVDVTGGVVPVEESMNLKAPSHVVCGGYFVNIDHVNVKKRLSVIDPFCWSSHSHGERRGRERWERGWRLEKIFF